VAIGQNWMLNTTKNSYTQIENWMHNTKKIDKNIET
jgi:hypothetical protein